MKLSVSKYVLLGKMWSRDGLPCVLNIAVVLNVCFEFVNLKLFHLYVLLLADMTYFVILVLSF